MAKDNDKVAGPGVHKRHAEVPLHAKLAGLKKSDLRLASLAKPKQRPDGKRRLQSS